MRYERDKHSVEAAVEKKRPLPDWLEDEPPLMPGDEFYLTAFQDLGTCRQSGFGTGPIPWHHMVAYAERAGLQRDLQDAFVRILSEMDNGYLKWCSDEQDKKQKMQKAQNKAKTQRRSK